MLDNFRKDPKNTNKGTDKGKELLTRSIDECGWGESVVAGADGQMIVGNHRFEKMLEGGAEPIIIESDGTRPIIHIRTDLVGDDPKAKKLAILSNRSADLNHSYDFEEVSSQAQEFEFTAAEVGFTEQELTPASPDSSPGSTTTEKDQGTVGHSYTVLIDCTGEDQQRDLYERLRKEGLKVRVLTL